MSVCNDGKDESEDKSSRTPEENMLSQVRQLLSWCKMNKMLVMCSSREQV